MKPRAALRVQDRPQIAALVNPLRQRILEALVAEPRSAKAMAVALGTKPTKLYHHFQVLEACGLIRVSEKRQRRGAVERVYAAAAREFRLDPRALSRSPRRARSVFVEALHRTIGEVEQHQAVAKRGARAEPLLFNRFVVEASDAKLRELGLLVGQWVRSLKADKSRGRRFGVTLVACPTQESA